MAAGANGRRADVLVQGPDWRVALEAQHSYLGDLDRARRHRDYEAAGITAVWLYAPTNEPYLGESSAVSHRNTFIFDVEAREIGVLITEGVRRPHLWWQSDGDLIKYVDHLAVEGERWSAVAFVQLDSCGLDDRGLVVLPPELLELGDVVELERERQRRLSVDEALKRAREASIRAARDRRAHAAPRDELSGGEPRVCVLCGYRLDPVVYRGADRHFPEMGCGGEETVVGAPPPRRPSDRRRSRDQSANFAEPQLELPLHGSDG